jgi:hypothetical protein
MGTRLLVEVLHEDGTTKFVRDARIEDVNMSNLLFNMEMVLVAREFVSLAEAVGKQAEQIFAPERVARKLREGS